MPADLTRFWPDAPLEEPFDGRASEALRAGYCVFCMGTGQARHTVCPLCEGRGWAWLADESR